MPTSPISEVIHYLRSTLLPDRADLTDGQLLECFVSRREPAALEALVRRHGPMVWGVCRRILHDHHDAEDAFQAVFLVLVRKAASIRWGSRVGSWLYGVAHQTALKARATRARRKLRETQVQQMPEPTAAEQDDWGELQAMLDQELSRLPEKYRTVLVLCELEGKTGKEAAQQLRLPQGTVASRLARARALLARRLTARGITLSAGALAAVLANNASAGVPDAVLSSTIRAATLFAAGQAAAAGAVSVEAAALTDGVLKAMLMSKLAMKSVLALVTAIAVGVGIYAAARQADAPGRAEGNKEEARPAPTEKDVPLEDPLPAGSTMRLGTVRFRQGARIVSMAVSPDGKTAFVVNGTRTFGASRAFDLTSGRPGFTLEHDQAEAVALSPDVRTIVTKQELHLHVRDARTGRDLRTIELPKKNPWTDADALAFTPDGKAVATISDGKAIHLIDLESGKVVRDFPHEGWGVRGIALSPDGKLMAGGGYDNDRGIYFARLWEVETGKELRRFVHGRHGYGIRQLAFSPDGKTLASGADDGRLRLWEVATGKERKAFPQDGAGRIRGVAFAPDGKTVAAAGDSLRLYDAATGQQRLCIDRKTSYLHFSGDGKTLTAAVGGSIYRWDTATGMPLTPTAAGDSIVEQVLVTPDGARIITRGQEGDAHVWDGASGRHLRALETGGQHGLALSPDGRLLAWPVHEVFTDPASPTTRIYGSRIRLYDLAADRPVDRFPPFKGTNQDLSFTAAKTLVTVDLGDGTVRVWNVETGKEQRSFRIAPDGQQGRANGIRRAAISPDGTTLAVAFPPATDALRGLDVPPDVIRLWDLAAGKELRRLHGNRGLVWDMTFSPDGRLLATSGDVWDVAAGKRVMELPGDLPCAAFSGDGRSLASASFDGTIRIWETATWTERAHLPGSRVQRTALAFTPAGQVLAGSPDTTVLAWDVRHPRVAASVPLERAWDALAARDAGEAFQLEGRLLATPADAVQLFAERVKPAEALDAVRIRRLLADLGSDTFADREAAAQALLRLDEQADPYLEEALKNAESLEVRMRVKRLLEQRWGAALPPEQLRQVRAVKVLERIGDGASKRLLKRWAGGPAGARLTREASAALKRLEAASNRGGK